MARVLLENQGVLRVLSVVMAVSLVGCVIGGVDDGGSNDGEDNIGAPGPDQTTPDPDGDPEPSPTDPDGGTDSEPSPDAGVDPDPDPDPDPNPEPATAYQSCVDIINDYRATLDLTPYARWTDAEACVNGEAKSDAESGTAHGAFGSCGEFAQNECPNWGGSIESILSGCLAAMWAEGPGADFQAHGHYINMSSTQYSKVACGFYQKPDGRYWVIQNFR